MKITVTGGAGFLGSNLCKRLLEDNHSVLCIDNLLRGDENIKSLYSNPNFVFLKHDVIEPLPENLEADQIYHLASPASPNPKATVNIHKLPLETMLTNTKGTWQLAELAISLNSKFLFASTSEVYGEPLEHPQKETYRGNVSTTGPRSIYDEAKRFGETITSAFVKKKGLDGRIVRIFNTYGPNMDIDDGRVVIEFIVAALKDNPIPIFGDGSQTRSFCFVDDLVEGLIKVMNSPKASGEIFNLGNPQEITVLELAKKIKELTNSKSEIIFPQDLPKDDPTRRCPDISKAKNTLRWEPIVSLEDGLKQMIQSVKTKLN